ncbi:MAG: hypothetical protein IPP29_01955 [Bacteroidetes bacterium]|nr:hypothetical protein [Bacteroidota bacterium]
MPQALYRTYVVLCHLACTIIIPVAPPLHNTSVPAPLIDKLPGCVMIT